MGLILGQGGGRPQITAAVPPLWMLLPGESVFDNLPAGLALLNYTDYWSAGTLSFGQTMAAARAAATSPYCVVMPAGTFHITDFSVAAGSGVGKGWQDVNSTKYFAGCIGAGGDQTFIVQDPGVMTAAQLSGVASGSPSPVQIYSIYAGGSALSVPTFFSGITFRGNLQQSTTLSGLTGTAPAPYNGLTLNSVQPGSMVQYCRFQGFGYAAKASPPYETPAVGSNHSSWTLRRCEIDGRLAPEIDPTRPVASGGLMWNYETNVAVIDSELHHTRRSGWAMHDHATSEGGNANDPGVYYARNFNVHDIADTSDASAGSALGFPCSNVEEVRNTFTYVRTIFTSNSAVGPQHITIATSGGNSMANSIAITDPIVRNSAYNGCLVVRFVITPNGSGTDPYYTAYQSGGFGALPITVTQNGTTLTPVLSTSFNANANTPANSYVVIFS